MTHTLKKRIKYSLLSLLGLAMLFMLTLVIHIAVMVRNKPVAHAASLQLARIDFDDQVAESTIQEVESAIRATPGVSASYYNPAGKTLVYGYDRKQLSSAQVFEQQVTSRHIQASRHLISDAQLAQGCPAIKEQSFYGKLTRVVSDIVN